MRAYLHHATRAGYCAGCSHICEKSLNHSLPIGDIMRSLMYLECHGEPDRARQTYARALAKRKANRISLDVSVAQSVCPQGLDIDALLRQAEKRLA